MSTKSQVVERLNFDPLAVTVEAQHRLNQLGNDDVLLVTGLALAFMGVVVAVAVVIGAEAEADFGGGTSCLYLSLFAVYACRARSSPTPTSPPF